MTDFTKISEFLRKQGFKEFCLIGMDTDDRWQAYYDTDMDNQTKVDMIGAFEAEAKLTGLVMAITSVHIRLCKEIENIRAQMKVKSWKQ